MYSRWIYALLAVVGAIHVARAQTVETSDKDDTTGMPRVKFFRPPSVQNHGFSVAVYCDLTKVAELRNSTYFEIALSPGEHKCSAEVVGTRRTIGNTENTTTVGDLTLEVRPGPPQWVSVRVKVGMVASGFKLATASPSEAAKEVERKHMQSVKPEDQTVRSIRRTPTSQ